MTDPVLTAVAGGVARVTLNRPEVHNAFDDALIAALTSALERLAADTSVRVLVLTGAGQSFSAGADLNWMRRMATADEQRNEADAMAMADLLRELAFFDKPTIARVNGNAFGGGVGLIACCDVALATEDARFGLTEVKLGLVPAVISPYVIAAIGQRHARRLFQTAEVFDAIHACRLGLVHRALPAAELDPALEREIGFLLKAGPQALRAAKSLVGAVVGRTRENQLVLDQATAKLIARLRVSEEGREGIVAFLEKRPPRWTPTDE